MLPTKLQTGQVFKDAVVRKINDIIDYLKSQRIVPDNQTITVSQCTGGLVIHAMPQSTSPKSTGGTSIELGILTTSPQQGAMGQAAYKTTKFDANGGHTDSPDTKPTIVPYMGGYYGV